jgi:hypothetical protein
MKRTATPSDDGKRRKTPLIPGSKIRRTLESLRDLDGDPILERDLCDLMKEPRGNLTSSLSKLHSAEYVERRGVWTSDSSQMRFEYRIAPAGLAALRVPTIEVGDWH